MTKLAPSKVGPWRLVAQRVVPAAHAAEEVVDHLAALQAQDLRAAATAVAVRSEGTTSGLAAALNSGSVVRSWPMRGTLHLLAAADLRWVLDLCAGRTVSATARRRRELEIDDTDIGTAGQIAAGLLTAGPASRTELLAAFEAAGQPTATGRGYHLLLHLSLLGQICQGPLRGREQLFVAADDWVTTSREPSDPLAEWTRRYLRGHGPATVNDFAAWTKLTLGDARRGFAAVRGEFEAVEVDGVEHLVEPTVPELATEHRRPARNLHLLPGFDEFLLGYADRSHVLPPEHADRVAPGGNGVFRGMVVVNGRIVGTWTRNGDAITPEAFTEFTTTQLTSLARRSRWLTPGWFA